MKCLQCESQDTVRNVEVFDESHGRRLNNLEVGIHENPSAFIFKGTKFAKVRGNVCVSCGFLMFSVSKADAISLGKVLKY